MEKERNTLQWRKGSGTGMCGCQRKWVVKVFTGDVTVDISSRMDSGMQRPVLSAQGQMNTAKLTGPCFRAQMDNDPKQKQPNSY